MDILNLVDWTLVQAFLTNVLTTLLITALGFVVAYVQKKLALVKAQVNVDQWEFIEQVVGAAVKVAEQTELARKVTLAGAEKKAIALQYAQTALDSYGVKVNVTTLEGAIEKAVLEHFNWGRLNPPD